MRLFRRFPFLRRRYYLHIICLISLVVMLIMEKKNPNFYWLLWDNQTIPPRSSVLNLSNPTSLVINQSTSSFVNLSNSYSMSSSFRNELINQRLASYFSMYENSSYECNTSIPLTSKQKESFSVILETLQSLRQQIVPYPNEYFHGRGIVLTLGQKELKMASVNLKMLEASKTRLPVQIWFSSTQVSYDTVLKLLADTPSLNWSICCFDTEECHTNTRDWELDATHVYKPNTNYTGKHFPYKPAAIISSTFAEVLFLDCDAFVTRDPEELFLSDPMYLKFGALFYPDGYKSRQHPSIWKMLNTTCGAEEYELDSATILVDKRRVWNGLYLTKLMNDKRQIFYEHITDGDKDTFRLGFRYMNVKYYLVMIPCATGSFDGSYFCGKTLCKTDSLGQHIYINHIHIIKHEGMRYSPGDLDYTRVGLGDPNNSSLSLAHCKQLGTKKTCFYIMKNPNLTIAGDICSINAVPSAELEDHRYLPNELLLFDQSRNNRALISKTNNLMPSFLDNFVKHIRARPSFNIRMSAKSKKDPRFSRADRLSHENLKNRRDRSRLNGLLPHQLPGRLQYRR